MDVPIDNKILRESPCLELAGYFRDIHARSDNRTVLQRLLESVRSESVPPRAAVVWIHGFADVSFLVDAMRFEESRLVRRSAIKRFGRSLRSDTFMDAWTAVGGTEELVQLFTELSVCDVDYFCRCLARSATCVVEKDARRKCMTELVKALASNQLPDSKLKSREGRPLLRYYAKIIPACTPELVQQWQHSETLPAANHFRLCQAHTQLLQHQCLEKVKTDHDNVKFSDYLPLCHTLPPLPAANQMSQSMQFSAQLLRRMETEKLETAANVVLQYDELLRQLAYPLLRRLEKRNHTATLQAEVIQSVLRCLQARPELWSLVSIDTSDLFDHIIRLWIQGPEKHEDMLVSFVKMVAHHQVSSLDAILDPLRKAGQYSYKLLALLLKHLQPYRVELEDDHQIKKVDGLWPVNIFLSVPKRDARALLTRLRKLRPAVDFINWWRNSVENSILDVDDVRMLQIVISEDSTSAFEWCEKLVQESQRTATTSREQTDRADAAMAAIFYSISSGSPELYEKTLLWARRFNRDALTVKKLYGPAAVQTREGLDMLCGISAQSNYRNESIAELRDRITKGNQIMLLLLETACMSLQEPSFYPADWNSVIGLFGVVTHLRIERSRSVQKSLGLSDDEVYNSLWSDTLNMLLSAERTLLQNERLPAGSRLSGPLQRGGQSFQMGELRGATSRFLDDLARLRNALWEAHRRTTHPAVVVLPLPFTKGLPIQYLVPFEINSSDRAVNMPFLMSLAESVVFVESRFALQPQPKDQETRAAITEFVDYYPTALKFYVNSQGEAGKISRIQRAWDYALKELSHKSMEQNEAILFWLAVFRRANITEMPQIDYQTPERPGPILPDIDDPSEPAEWDPDPRPDRWVQESRTLPPTCMDVLLDTAGYNPPDIRSEYQTKESSTVRYVQQPFWKREQDLKSMAPKVREGLIVAALLYINTKYCAQDRILAERFPSASDVRYPALFLDDDFLDRKDVGHLTIFVMGYLRQDVPSTLIRFLCNAMLERLRNGQKADAALKSETFFMLRTLIIADRLDVALELIGHVIVERPEDSSWHRHILTRGLLNGLSPGRAKRFLSDLADKIQTSLQQQAERRNEPQNEQDTLSTSPLGVKVTTVKLFAQLMSGAKFVDEHFTIDVLLGLFRKSGHLDIRVAIIETLTSTLVETKDESVREKILDALETHAVPIAAAMNERIPMTEEEWKQAEENGVLSEAYEPGTGTLPPVLDALVQASSKTRSFTDVMVNRILLPIVRMSAANNQRWMSLFLRLNGFSLQATSLPPLPVKPDLVATLVQRHVEYMPATLLKLLAEATLLNLQSPEDLKNINKSVRESPTLGSSNAGLHWLFLWDNKSTNALAYGRLIIAQLLSTQFTSKIPGGISHEQVVETVKQQSEITIMRGDDTFEEQNYLFNQLAPPFRRNEEKWDLWQQYTSQLVAWIIDKIESLRTPQWQRDPNRQPAALQDTYTTKLWLLTYPSMPWMSDHRDKCDKFAAELSTEVDALANVKGTYHHRFSDLTSAALKAWPADYCYLACKLVPVDQCTAAEPDLANLLRVELADALLRSAEEPKNSNDATQARMLLQDWKSSTSEDIRMKGMRTTRFLSQKKDGKGAWFSEDVWD